jgi:hypothetical protein
MACHWIKIPGKDGQPDTIAHINMGRSPRRKCGFCNTGWVEALCDFPVAPGKTCDRGMCRRCGTRIAHEVDHCPNHKGKTPSPPPAEQNSLF